MILIRPLLRMAPEENPKVYMHYKLLKMSKIKLSLLPTKNNTRIQGFKDTRNLLVF
jgi:hypothetical protein